MHVSCKEKKKELEINNKKKSIIFHLRKITDNNLLGILQNIFPKLKFTF